MLVRKLEDPDGRAMVGRKLDFRNEHRERDTLRSACANYHGEILLAVDAVADGAGARHVVQADFPELGASRVVVGGEIAVESANEDNSTRGVERTGGKRSALAVDPQHFFRFEVEGFEAADFSVLVVGPHADEPVHARGA